MNDPSPHPADAISAEGTELNREEMQAALFAQLVLQQTNMAMMLLGKSPHPQTGQPQRDLEGAKFFIDQLEVLEVKTRGNLSKEEENLLKQSLMALRLAFVEVVEAPPSSTPTTGSSAPPATAPITSENKSAPTADAGAADEEESRKRFSKKY